MNVDELISFLKTNPNPSYRFLDVSAWSGRTNEAPDRRSVWLVQDDRYDVHFHGDTLLEALEAAALAVQA